MRTDGAPTGGEALMLDPPLNFRIRPGVLRVRVARKRTSPRPRPRRPRQTRATV